MGDRENYGILGTPLDHTVAGEFRSSKQNKIAPTPTAYTKFKQREIVKEERSLLEKTSLLATKNDNLYVKDGGRTGLGQLMDEEDKTHLRIRETIKRNRMNTGGFVSSQQRGASSFLAKSAEIPEIVPKQARTALGFGVLQRIYSLPRVEESKFEPKLAPSALHHISLYSSTELQRESRTGLGYRDDEEPIRERVNSRQNRTFLACRDEKGVKAFGAAVNRPDYDSDEDDCTDELANAGYRDLDSTAKLLSQRLQESRPNSTGRTSEKKRAVRNVENMLEERVQFSDFAQSEVSDTIIGGWTEYDIPLSFAADPTHRFETDSMETLVTALSQEIRQEYAARLKLHVEKREKEAKASGISIAKANEEHQTRSRRIKDLIAKDMGSRFIEPNALQTLGITSSNPRCEENGAMCKSPTAVSPKRGETKRTNQVWKPESLLCRRLGVKSEKPALNLNSPKTKALGSGNLLSSHDDDDDGFLIHSVAPASTGVLDFSNETILTGEQMVGLHGNEDLNNADVGISNYNVNRSPSQRLAQAIFTNAKTADGKTEQPDDVDINNFPSNTNLRGTTEAKGYSRGVHRTRAVDFF